MILETRIYTIHILTRGENVARAKRQREKKETKTAWGAGYCFLTLPNPCRGLTVKSICFFEKIAGISFLCRE